MRFWVDVPDDEDWTPVDADHAVVMESGALIFMNNDKSVIAAFHSWNYMLDNPTSDIEDP